MGCIYRIYRIADGKSYIGQTIFSAAFRFKQHVYNAFEEKSAAYNQHIKRAIRKYGKEAFAVETLETCDDYLLDEREKYWIEYFDSVKTGYNMTYGGEGKVEYDSQALLSEWQRGMNITEISNITGICEECISKHLKKMGVTSREINDRRYASSSRKRGKAVYQYDLDGRYVGEYKTVREAIKAVGCVTIYGAIDKRRKSAGYMWSYTKTDSIEPFYTFQKHQTHQYSLDGRYIQSFDSRLEAAESIGVHPARISDVVCGRRNSCGGFLWSNTKHNHIQIDPLDTSNLKEE